MPVYHVLIEGSDFELSSSDGEPLVGFYVWRKVEAADEAEATRAARERVQWEWAEGPRARAGIRPYLVPLEIHRLGWLRRLRAKNTGYVFFPAT